VSFSQRVLLWLWTQARAGSGGIDITIPAGGGISSLRERAYMIAVRNASSLRNSIGQSTGATSWPTTAQTLTVGADNSAAMSIITNRSTSAQTLSTANGFSVVHTDTDQPATAVAFRTVDTPSQAVPRWTGSGGLRAQQTFEIVWAPNVSGMYLDGAIHLS
jgi:hypothetical protein